MKGILAIAALAALGVSPVYADCASPGNPPTVPDGNAATAQDILKTQQDVVNFQTATQTYLACIKKAHDDAIAAGGANLSASEGEKLDSTESKEHNAAVHQLKDVVTRFNQSVATFKAKQAAAQKKPAKGKD